MRKKVRVVLNKIKKRKRRRASPIDENLDKIEGGNGDKIFPAVPTENDYDELRLLYPLFFSCKDDEDYIKDHIKA